MARTPLSATPKRRGITVAEMEHVAMLRVTTLGFPAAGRALAWIHETKE
ncbi:MAG TPA: hypothetical protein VMT53_25720 [Terriglobales bacterium]|nr:hypothetical protein [Terriglobales bacterium]